MIYVARTDFNIAQVPSILPDVSKGAGSIFMDPDFGTTIIRATDRNTINRAASFSVGSAGNNCVWNVDSTRFWFTTMGSGCIIADFDPVALKITPRPDVIIPPDSRMNWSCVDPTVLYVVTKQQIWRYTISAGGYTSTLLVDFSTFLLVSPLGWKSDFTVSKDDENFTIAYGSGAQGTGHLCFVYTQGLGIRVFDTATGIVSGQWGPTGQSTYSGGGLLHEAQASLLGDYVLLGVEGKVFPYFWSLKTLNVVANPGPYGGHPTMGYTTWFQPGGVFGGMLSRPYTNLNSITRVVSNIPPGYKPPIDSHSAYHNADPLDSQPLLQITTSPTFPFPAAWYNEILLFNPLSGVVYRECHTFSSSKSKYFSAANAVGTISQDGRFVIWATDYMGTLGADESGNPASDIFICRFK